jgi:DNA-directed RNA polymerase specialized sigma24 family protein
MAQAASRERMALEQDQRITEVVERERSRLGSFIRRRVPDPRDAEDILQDVFSALVEANRLFMPIEQVTGWLFTVARNRITDLFRKKEDSCEDSVACGGLSSGPPWGSQPQFAPLRAALQPTAAFTGWPATVLPRPALQ